MHYPWLLSSQILALTCLATQAAQIQNNGRQIEPCAQVSDWIAQAKTIKGIPGNLAYGCLTSMPFDAEDAVKFVDEYRKYLQFQSTIENLKTPPGQYSMPSTDLLGGLDNIRRKAQNHDYSSHWDFESDLTQLISSAHDAHLTLQLCSTVLFRFSNSVPLVSLSSDGLELPQVYTLASQTALGTPRNNGLWSRNVGEKWTGDRLTLTFANGSSVEGHRTADLIPQEFPYRNGTALFNARCRKESIPTTATAASDSGGYPNTTWSSYGGLIAGYFSQDEALRDVGVLAVTTFSIDAATMQRVSVDFLRNATEAGKKRIIVDLSGNPGGSLTAGVDLFHIFFPDVVPYTATRLRAHTGAEFLSKAFARLAESHPKLQFELWDGNPFSWQAAVTPNQDDNFKSLEAWYGPYEIDGAPLSNLYANFNFTSISTTHSPITGYGPIPLDLSQRLYFPEDIIIITDGNCLSTCAYFVDRMQRQGVRTVAFGGRPQYGPMQAIGGTRGGQNLAYGGIYSYVETAHNLIRKSLRNGSTPLMSFQEWAQFNRSIPRDPDEFPFVFGGGVNLRNEYAPGDDATPQQFTYQAADCRLFYTAESWFSQEEVWRAAAVALFGGKSSCSVLGFGEGSIPFEGYVFLGGGELVMGGDERGVAALE
ncbi:peptidase S41 family protein [Aspergillus fumigatus Af293]|uniref:Peptidase S41 family protein n=1 Tax=Aspergillus fumigatus (strain ATCC MYA-4609 / CBS 101355 / FGSC A1100 / Af293) TaxID=330879 RepID=Q4WR63_ASPFU|nr:peptidase S41 family protein [Aspergillus fumigatus Af293]EAL91069.1 peptidase S41 family protein [Aspergillus fumigatus Af293]